MSETIRYVVFPTEWGYFGLAASGRGLVLSVLPAPSYERARRLLLAARRNAAPDRALCLALQRQIARYFSGRREDFRPHPALDLRGLPAFSRSVLAACRRVPYGQTATYLRLAESCRRPSAARAAGRVLAANPLPLIVPCHRVIRSDGSPGGYSATGGAAVKKRLLEMEKRSESAVGQV
jgi:methylated-DNA-[protein]-cysteine S-methyltransferase